VKIKQEKKLSNLQNGFQKPKILISDEMVGYCRNKIFTATVRISGGHSPKPRLLPWKIL